MYIGCTKWYTIVSTGNVHNIGAYSGACENKEYTSQVWIQYAMKQKGALLRLQPTLFLGTP